MKAKYMYEAKSSILLEADNQDDAEKHITGLSLNDFITNERIFEVDEVSYPCDLEIRKELFDTHLHPLDDDEEYERFIIQLRKYGQVIYDFLHGKFGKDEFLRKIGQAESKEIDLEDSPIYAEIQHYKLKGKKQTTVRLVSVD